MPYLIVWVKVFIINMENNILVQCNSTNVCSKWKMFFFFFCSLYMWDSFKVECVHSERVEVPFVITKGNKSN